MLKSNKTRAIGFGPDARVVLSDFHRGYLRGMRFRRRYRVKPFAQRLGIAPRTLLAYESGERSGMPRKLLTQWHNLLLEEIT